jgi:Domain of unknown function (DUF5919)
MGPPAKWVPALLFAIAGSVIAAYIFAAGVGPSVLVLAVLPILYLFFLLVSGIATLNVRFVHRTWGRDRHLESGLIRQCRDSFDFMTITGRTSLNRAEVEAAIKERGSVRSCRFRILLLDPESEHLDRFCRVEGSSPAQTREKIHATTKSLLRVKAEHRVNLSVRWYDSYPVWRVAVVDNATAHVGYYQRGRKGYEGPRLVCPSSPRGGLFAPFSTEFEEAWRVGRDPEMFPESKG